MSTYTIESINQANTSIIINDSFKDKMRVFVEKILKDQHKDKEKQYIKVHKERLQFACPYCGDSHKHLNKKRGNLYFETLFYHCFNDGCPSPHVDFATFLLDFGYSREKIIQEFGSFSEIKRYAKEHVKQLHSITFRNIKTNNAVLGDAFAELSRHGVLIQDMLKVLNAKRAYDYPMAMDYLKSRLQHKNHERFLVSNKGLWVLNLTADLDRIVGMQLKTFSKKASYITYDIGRIYTELLGDSLKCDDDMAFRINNMSTLFNILTTRLSGRVTVFEGPLDAFLMPNSIALSTVKRDTTKIEQLPNIRFLFDNDKAGREYAFKKLDRGFPVFLWSKLIQDLNIRLRIKDFNDLIKYAYKHKIKIYDILDTYFSNVSYDKFYV